jgi:hypothetical protein
MEVKNYMALPLMTAAAATVLSALPINVPQVPRPVQSNRVGYTYDTFTHHMTIVQKEQASRYSM